MHCNGYLLAVQVGIAAIFVIFCAVAVLGVITVIALGKETRSIELTGTERSKMV